MHEYSVAWADENFYIVFFFAMELETRCMELEAFAPAGNNYFLA